MLKTIISTYYFINLYSSEKRETHKTKCFACWRVITFFREGLGVTSEILREETELTCYVDIKIRSLYIFVTKKLQALH